MYYYERSIISNITIRVHVHDQGRTKRLFQKELCRYLLYVSVPTFRTEELSPEKNPEEFISFESLCGIKY
jgi:hypothetical protein